MRINGKRGTYKGREITGLLDYNEEKNSVIFTTFYRIDFDKTKTFYWSTEITENDNFDVMAATEIVKQISSILGSEELSIFCKLFKQLRDNLM